MLKQFSKYLSQDDSGHNASQKWSWKIPEHFNIYDACVEQHANSQSTANQEAIVIADEQLGEQSLSYKQLQDATSLLANGFASLGVSQGARVLIRLPNSLEYPIGFFSCLKYGAIAVPTSTLLSASEVAYLAKDSGAEVLVTHADMWTELEQTLDSNIVKTVILTGGNAANITSTEFNLVNFDQLMSEQSTQFKAYNSLADDPAYLVYTSGTTGYPKGVLHAHRALLGRLPASQFWFDFNDETKERILHSGKFNWTYVLGSALMDPLFHGHTVIAYEGGNNASTWPELIQKHDCTIFIGVPTIYRQIVQKTEFTRLDLPSLKHCMSAGEHLSDEMQTIWLERFGQPIYEAIGMSEVSYYISQHKSAKVVPGAAGFMQPGHKVELLDAEFSPAGTDEEGMICIHESDPGLFLRYWNLPEETENSRKKGWFTTGDYARRDAEGYVWFLGRKDDIINSFGYRISPYEIERVIKTHPMVADCVAVGEEIAKDKTLVVACIILEDDVENVNDGELEEVLFAFGQEQLARYKAPKKVIIVNDYPRTKNGKVLRKQLVKDISSS